MALVPLSSVAAFFDGNVMLMASAVKVPMILVFFLKKEPGMSLPWCHARVRDKIYPVQVSFSDSLWARIRRSRTNVGPRIQDPEENERADSKTNFYFIFLFDRVRSWESYNLYCTTILSGAQTKTSLSASVTSSLSSPIGFQLSSCFGKRACGFSG